MEKTNQCSIEQIHEVDLEIFQTLDRFLRKTI